MQLSIPKSVLCLYNASNLRFSYKTLCCKVTLEVVTFKWDHPKRDRFRKRLILLPGGYPFPLTAQLRVNVMIAENSTLQQSSARHTINQRSP
jgi:hypothetical protein